MGANFDNVLTNKLESSPFWTQVGFKLENNSEGRVRIRLPYNVGNTTAATALHGGAISATLDAAGCLAAWSSEIPDGLCGHLIACDVSYVAGALGEDIYGEAEVLRRGKEIVYASIRAVNGDGKLLACGNHIYHLSAPEPSPAAPENALDTGVNIGRTSPGIGSLSDPDNDIVQKNISTVLKMDGLIPYMSQLSWKFSQGGYGCVEFLLSCEDHSVGDDGGLASGALLSAVDHAGSVAAWMTSELGKPGLFGSTVNTKLKVFAPAIKRDVIVKARAVGGSGTIIHSNVDILSLAGEPVASGSTVYRIVNRG
ncbi:MAG TPA: PaaI family thioesterase [Halieaceae bacterium]|nr:PaaI family thioesterase [Halieaceae bacterium]